MNSIFTPHWLNKWLNFHAQTSPFFPNRFRWHPQLNRHLETDLISEMFPDVKTCITNRGVWMSGGADTESPIALPATLHSQWKAKLSLNVPPSSGPYQEGWWKCRLWAIIRAWVWLNGFIREVKSFPKSYSLFRRVNYWISSSLMYPHIETVYIRLMFLWTYYSIKYANCLDEVNPLTYPHFSLQYSRTSIFHNWNKLQGDIFYIYHPWLLDTPT